MRISEAGGHASKLRRLHRNPDETCWRTASERVASCRHEGMHVRVVASTPRAFPRGGAGGAQVMCEAAGGAMRALVDNCRTHHLLPHLTSPLISDRSVKLRACCAAYLLQVRILGRRPNRAARAGAVRSWSPHNLQVGLADAHCAVGRRLRWAPLLLEVGAAEQASTVHAKSGTNAAAQAPAPPPAGAGHLAACRVAAEQ